MQQVASQLGMFSPIALQFGAYGAYTQAVSTAPAGQATPLLLASSAPPSPSQCQGPGLGGEPRGARGPVPTVLSPRPQLMQQQAAVLAAHSAYLSPMATMAAVQMQHMAAINANGLIATPITPSSGEAQEGLRWWAWRRSGGYHTAGWGGGLRGQTAAGGLQSACTPAEWSSVFVCRLLSAFSSPGTSTPPAIAATPVSAIPAALGVNGYSPVPTQPAGQPAPDALYPNGVHPYPGGGLCCPPVPSHRSHRRRP